MKKTYNISLGGCIFHLEEDAGDKLQTYIRTLEHYYSQEEGGQEIMSDIENRIAELFQQYLQETQKEVISLPDVEQAIDTMGHPDDLINEDPSASETKKQFRRLYRDIDNRMLGGVAAGIAAYLNVSIVVVRLCFLLPVFFYGFTIWLYLILWIVIPAAITSKQKMEMKGEKINIPNIERNIRDRFQEVKENGKVRGTVQKTGNLVTEILNALGTTLYTLGKIVLIFIAVILVFVCILLLIFFAGFLFNLSFIHFPFIDGMFFLPAISGSYSLLLKISIGLTFLIPLILLIWLSAKLIFRFKSSKSVPLTLVGIWILGIVLLFITGASYYHQISEEEWDVKTTVLTASPDSCLFLKTDPHYRIAQSREYWGELSYYLEKNKELRLNKPELRFEETSRNIPEISVRRKSFGYSIDDALENAQNIDYRWKMKNDTLFLDNYFSIPRHKKWRSQEVEIIVRIPENYSVHIDQSLRNGPKMRHRSYHEFGKHYVMKNGRLQLKEEQ